MKLDATIIEKLATSKLKESLLATRILDPAITETDKGPSWDGSVYLYKSSRHTKENMVGRVPVQVKGKVATDLSKKSIKFSVRVVDLKNFLNDGGAIFFVVYLSDDLEESKVYYIELTPIRLRVLLKNIGKQRNKTITFKEFPSNNDEKASIIFTFFQHCSKQASFAGVELKTLDEFERQGNLESIVIPICVPPGRDPQLALINSDVYIYAKIKGTDILVPTELIPENMFTKETVRYPISVEGKTYYNEAEIVTRKENFSICFGKSFSVDVPYDGQAIKINYKSTDSLRQRAIDMGFMLKVSESGGFEINGQRIEFDNNKKDIRRFNSDKNRKELAYYKKIVNVLEKLNCKEDVDLKTLKNNDWRTIDRLITAFVDKKPIAIKDTPPTVFKCGVGDLAFILLSKPIDGQDGAYFLYDFFSTELLLVYENEQGEKLPTSMYSLLKADDYLCANNIRFDVIVPSFEKIEFHEGLIGRATWVILELLNAYDKSNCKLGLALKTAHDLVDWIGSKEQLSEDNQINYYQILKREGKLSQTEITKIYEIVESGTDREDLLTAAYLLIDQDGVAIKHFEKMSDDEKTEFIEYPIFNLCKDKTKWKSMIKENDN